MKQIGFPETSVSNEHYSLHNNPEERISHYIAVEMWKHAEFDQLVKAATIT
jgi:hypothetical protein